METRLLKNEFTIGKWKVRSADLLFISIFMLVSVFFIYSVPYGITESDESLYQFFCYRLQSGDKLFADDWAGTNWIAIFAYIPYRFFTTVLGGTEGLLLALRYLHVGIKLIFLAYIYVRLRAYGLWAVFAGVFYVGTDLMGIKTMNYYSVCLNAVFLTGMILFVKKPKAPFWYIAAGALFSCAVIAEPPLALFWAGYCLLVLFRYIWKKKGRTTLQNYDFVLDTAIWRRMLYGICAAITVFLILCATFFTGTDLKAIITGLRAIPGFYDYAGISAASIHLMNLKLQLWVYRPVYVGLFLFLFFLAVPLHRFTRRYEKLLFTALSALFVCMSVRLLSIRMINLEDSLGECCSHPLLLALLSVVAYTFTRKRNRQMFAFLIFSFAVSGIVDLFSNCTFGSMLLAGCVPIVLLLRDYFLEQWTLFRTAKELPDASAAVDKKTVKKQDRRSAKTQTGNVRTVFCRLYPKAYIVVLCTMLCVVPLYEIAHYVYMGYYHETERCVLHVADPLDTEIEAGLMKGIITTRDIADNYHKSVRDAAIIKQLCKKGLIVVEYDTTMYLNSGKPAYTYAMHVTFNNWEPEEQWWRLHPDKLPDVAYIPYDTLSYINLGNITPEEKMAYLESVADTTITKGEAGYIVQLENWRLP